MFANGAFPVDDKAAVSVENGTQEVKRGGDFQVADIDMSLLMGLEGLHIAGSFFGDVGRWPGQQCGLFEDTVDTGRAGGDDIGIDHHEGHTAIALGWILPCELADAGDFAVGQPMIAGLPGVVFVDFAEACAQS